MNHGSPGAGRRRELNPAGTESPHHYAYASRPGPRTARSTTYEKIRRFAHGKRLILPLLLPTRTPSAAFRLRPGFVNVHCSTEQVSSVQTGDGPFSFLAICHFHESESARLPGLAISDNTHVLDSAILREDRPKIIRRDAKIQITYKDVCQNRILSGKTPAAADRNHGTGSRGAVQEGPRTRPSRHL